MHLSLAKKGNEMTLHRGVKHIAEQSHKNDADCEADGLYS